MSVDLSASFPASWPRWRTRPRILTIEICNESLRQIDGRHCCENRRQELTEVERHRDAALPGKLIDRYPYLFGNRGHNLFVSLVDILVQAFLLRLQLELQAFALLFLR